MIQSAFLTALYLYGLFISHAVSGGWRERRYGDWRPSLLTTSALFFGLVSWTVAAIVILSLRLPYGMPLMILLLTLGAVLASFRYFRHPSASSFTRSFLRTAAFGGTAFFSLATAFHFGKFVFFSDDSFYIISLGRLIAQEHRLSDLAQQQLGDWGIFLPLVQSAATFFGQDYLWILQPVTAICFWSFFSVVCDDTLAKLSPGLTPKRRRGIIAAGVITGVSAYLVILELGYVHNGFLAGAFYFIFVASAFRFLESATPSWLASAWFGLVGFFLSRNEAAGIAAPIAFLFLTDERSFTPRSRIFFSGAFLAVITLWYATLFRAIGTGQSHLTPGRLVVMYLPYLALFFFALFSRVVVRSRLLNLMRRHLVGLIACAALSLFFLDRGRMLESAQAILQNIFFKGSWGMTWLLGLPVFFALNCHKKNDQALLLRQAVSLFLIAWFVMPFRQGSYRVGWGDSGNRNLAHILPVLLLYFVISYSEKAAKIELPWTESSQNDQICL